MAPTRLADNRCRAVSPLTLVKRLASICAKLTTEADPVDRMLDPAEAAKIARRSVRTIRRAYSSGFLVAYRDGAGRGVRIRYGDLREWMMSEKVVPPGTRRPADRAARVATDAESRARALLRSARAHTPRL